MSLTAAGRSCSTAGSSCSRQTSSAARRWQPQGQQSSSWRWRSSRRSRRMLKCGSCSCGRRASRAVLRWVPGESVKPCVVACNMHCQQGANGTYMRYLQWFFCFSHCSTEVGFVLSFCHFVCKLCDCWCDAGPTLSWLQPLKHLRPVSSRYVLLTGESQSSACKQASDTSLCSVVLCCVQAKDERIKELRAALGDLMESKQVGPACSTSRGFSSGNLAGFGYHWQAQPQPHLAPVCAHHSCRCVACRVCVCVVDSSAWLCAGWLLQLNSALGVACCLLMGRACTVSPRTCSAMCYHGIYCSPHHGTLQHLL